MIFWSGSIVNGKYNDNNQLKDIEITDKPLVVLSYGKKIRSYESNYHVYRPDGRKDYQLLYINEGEILFKINNKNITYGANTLMLIKPGDPQDRYEISENNRCISSYIHFSGNKAQELLDKYDINSPIIKFEENFNTFEDIINRMYSMKSSKHHEDFCNILLEELFIHISNKLNKSDNSITDGFNRLLEMMDLTCAKNYPIKFYAEQIHFSEEYFVRFFKKAMGVSPHKYIMTLRLQKAISMLIYTNYPIKTISQKLGFSNQHYFSKVFCDNYKMTPSEFRSQGKKKK